MQPMKVVLFCGGMGMRIREHSHRIPKPMVEIRKRPILWHIMRYYAMFGHTHFILCVGYKGQKIVDFFSRSRFRDWTFDFVDTGVNATIGDRLRAVRHLVENEPLFLANYADGVSDLPLSAVVDLNLRHESVCTFVSARPHLSYHYVRARPDGIVTAITSAMDEQINAGYFVFRQGIFDVVGAGEEIAIEGFRRLMAAGKLSTYVHKGYWQSCDTLKDLQILEDMCADERVAAPWELWGIEEYAQPGRRIRAVR